MKDRLRLLKLVLIGLGVCLAGRIAVAENIDPANQGLKYAYGENVGWFNFKPDQGPGVTVTALGLTGFAWAENIGWINLSPVNGGGVKNDGQGNLSGFAWGENVGWINFRPTGAGVHIDSKGHFIGKAWGENIGWVSFNSTGAVPFGVTTAWRRALQAPAMNAFGIVVLGIGLCLVPIYLRRVKGAVRSHTSVGLSSAEDIG
jgi:hypothetical protein